VVWKHSDVDEVELFDDVDR